MRIVSRALPFLLSAASLLVPCFSLAQSAGDVAEVVRQAEADAEAKRYEAAVDGFQRAFDLSGDPAYVYNIALLLQVRMKSPLRAWEYAKRFEAVAQSDSDKQDAVDLLGRIEAELARAYGKVVIAGLPERAETWIDARENERRLSRRVAWVGPGKHSILAEAPGHEPARVEFQVLVGATARVDIALKAPVKDVMEPRAAAAESKPEQSSGWLPWALVGGGAALAATGAVFHYLAFSGADDMKGESGDTYDTHKSSAQTKQTTAFILYGLGAAAAGAGVYFMVADDGSTGVSAAPLPDGGLVSTSVRF